MEKIRIDKYLWGIRIYKSRSLATEACREGKIKHNGTTAKSSAMVGAGDLIEVHKDNFRFKYKAITLIEKRVSAVLARPCYEDLTPAEELLKFKTWFVGKGGPERRERGQADRRKKTEEKFLISKILQKVKRMNKSIALSAMLYSWSLPCP